MFKGELRFVSLIAILLTCLTFATSVGRAQQTTYDPYADSVSAASAGVVDANNATGAPNGTSASLAGLASSLTLDMGVNEEGTQTLRVYFGQINATANVTVEFLAANQSVIKSETRQLNVDPNPSTQNFAYNWRDFTNAYRYVRISSPLGAGVNIDAVEALGYLGSTEAQDTDGDGRTDRSEQQNGTNPLVADPAATTTTTPTSSTSATSTTTATSTSSAGNTSTTNNSTTINNSSANPATTDTDGDGLTDRKEAELKSDPKKVDTDGDGMPDKWEYDHGLNLTKNDANEDPDGDYLTNLGENKNNTDPNKADDLRDVFCENQTAQQTPKQMWYWLVIALIILVGLAAWLKTKNSTKH